jgi:hypothetical protein
MAVSNMKQFIKFIPLQSQDWHKPKLVKQIDALNNRIDELKNRQEQFLNAKSFLKTNLDEAIEDPQLVLQLANLLSDELALRREVAAMKPSLRASQKQLASDLRINLDDLEQSIRTALVELGFDANNTFHIYNNNYRKLRNELATARNFNETVFEANDYAIKLLEQEIVSLRARL